MSGFACRSASTAAAVAGTSDLRRYAAAFRFVAVPVIASLVTACAAAEVAGPPGASVATASRPVPAAGERVGSGPATTQGSGPAEPTAAGDCEGVGVALRTRSRALATGDARLWSTSFAKTDATAAKRDDALFVTLRDLRVSLSVGPIRPRNGPPGAPGAAVCVAELGYAIPGFDRAPRVVVTTVHTQPRPGGGALITAVEADPQPRDLPGARIRRDPEAGGVVVIGDVPEDELLRADREARAARKAVAALWGTAPGLVLVLPRTTAELAAQLRRSETTLSATAAVTDGPLPMGEPATSDRIYLNLTAMSGLAERGRQSVVTHEAMHAAVRASTTRPVPMWLSEGFAQWAGYHHVGASTAETAPTLLAAVRGGHPPTDWPADIEFDPQTASGRPAMLAAYERSWSVVAYLTQRFGSPTVVAFYRSCATHESDCESTMPAFFGATRAELAAGWRAWLPSLGRRA